MMEHRLWFIFGEHPDGRVDIADSEGDVLTHVKKSEAERAIKLHNAAVNDLEDAVALLGRVIGDTIGLGQDGCDVPQELAVKILEWQHGPSAPPDR